MEGAGWERRAFRAPPGRSRVMEGAGWGGARSARLQEGADRWEESGNGRSWVNEGAGWGRRAFRAPPGRS